MNKQRRKQIERLAQQLDEIAKGTGMSKSEIFRSVLGIRKGENRYDLKNYAEEEGDRI